MTSIILNSTEFNFGAYTRQLLFNKDHVLDSIYIGELSSETLQVDILPLTTTVINQIQIKQDNNIIYNITNLNAHIDSVTELYLNDTIVTNLEIKAEIPLAEEEEI